MPLKSFERTILFTEVRGRGWYPIVEVTFIKVDGRRRILPLLFDTGASVITLRPEYEWLFPPGTICDDVNTGGSNVPTYGVETAGRIEFLGQTMDCPILLLPMPPNPLWAGLFGRECFERFGFGYWQSAHELYATVLTY
jgi:hypothetical protein